jgi:hypothetical protein
MDAAIIVAELAAAYAAATITFGAGYAACLAAANKRSKLKWNHLFGFGLLTPVLWISMSALTGLAGAYCDALPPNLSALLYAAIICAIPSAILSASVIDDIKAPRPPPPPKKTTKSTTIQPPPHDFWEARPNKKKDCTRRYSPNTYRNQ